MLNERCKFLLPLSIYFSSSSTLLLFISITGILFIIFLIYDL